jgi:exoribonuclease R
MAGKWVHRSSQNAQFYVPEFVTSQQLDEIIPYLPTTDAIEMGGKILQKSAQSVPREVGKPLIDKMLRFWAQSDSTYQSTAFMLDNAHQLVGDDHRYKYATLDEIAEILIPESISKTKDGLYPQHVLYAVHRSLLRDEIGFRPQARGTLRAGGQYEIFPVRARKCVNRVKGWVRNYQEAKAAGVNITTPSGAEIITLFVAKAQMLIDASRKTRQHTAHGIIGPLSTKSENPKSVDGGVWGVAFQSSDRDIVQFLESWAALDSFSLHSPLNGIGSSILRAIERYPDDLSPATAWTMLQEIGAIAPWENRALFELRLGTVRSFSAYQHRDGGYSPDTLESIRKVWPAESTVYCVDDPGAHEIDDGLTIEPTESPDEYWIHVHTADPAAHILPDSEVGQHAKLAIETVYMPERVVPMLNPHYVKSNLSLDCDRPCLTFSAKMNMKGDILEYTITAGRIQSVIYLSYDVLKEVVSGTESSDPHHTLHRVGQPIQTHSPSRRMTECSDLSNYQKRDLQLLHKIGTARAEKLKAKGGISDGSSGLSVSVSLNGAEPPSTRDKREASLNFSIQYATDPTIQLRTVKVDAATNRIPYSQGNTVQNFMLVAGEVAARWCNERGIPIPYRVTPRNLDKIDPAMFYTEHVLPSMDDNGNPSTEQLVAYMKLLGVQPSTTPGPHVAIGVDMMAKCTSPLRRFGDLLLHWQVEATLLEEHRSGQSLLGSTRDDFLPFTRVQLDNFLPQLDNRERLISYGKSQANRHWICHYLVRAWKFGEAPISSSLPFLVRRVDPANNRVFGTLTTYLTSAECIIPEDLDLDVKDGDTLEVELEDVNVYLRSIKVKARGRWDENLL